MVNLLPSEIVTYNFTANNSAVDEALASDNACNCEPSAYGKCLSALVEPTSIRTEEEYSFEFHQKFHVGDVLSIALGTSLTYDVQVGKTEIGYDVTGSKAPVFRETIRRMRCTLQRVKIYVQLIKL